MANEEANDPPTRAPMPAIADQEATRPLVAPASATLAPVPLVPAAPTTPPPAAPPPQVTPSDDWLATRPPASGSSAAPSAPDAEATAASLRSVGDRSTAYRTAGTAAPNAPNASKLRFHVLHVHAKGGLGQVSVAQDGELHREVALKEIQDQHADDRDSRQRFLQEARITGKLEHPGIVPVYGLGHYPDGRPFYAMRFIKGDSLKEAIEHFHKPTNPPRDAAAHSLELHKLLRRFMDICNAIAYAHSRGVLHRDLKPGNVMLGQFGETLVVDWGLAKSVDQSGASSGGDTPAPAAFAGDATATQMGQAVGTPQFMSPEQAAGQLDRLGPASDVYSLGATLYCLLTGRVPFEARDVGEVLRKVQAGDFAPPRRVHPSVPRALDAICRKAMALAPEDRYASAQALAEDIDKWLADAPVSAWREPWHIRLRRWVVRHRTLVTSCASAAVVGVISLTIVLLLVRASQERELNRLARAREEAQRHLYAGEAALKVKDWQEAKLNFARALTEIGAEPALENLTAQATRLQGETEDHLAKVAARSQARLQHLEFGKQRDHALFQYGTVFTSTDAADQQANLLATRKAIHSTLGLVGVELEGQKPVAWNKDLTKSEANDIAEGCYGLLLMLADVEAQSKRLPEAVGILERAVQVGSPSQAYHLRRARYLEQLGKNDEARRASDRAQSLKPAHAVDWFLLGDEWYKRGRMPEALAAFDHALRLQPDDFWSQFFLAVRYLEAHRPEEAKAGLTACLSRRSDFPWLYLLRGIVLGGAGEFDRAEADFARALELHPDPGARYLLLTYRGGMRGRREKWDDAISDLKEAISLRPDSHQAQEALAQVYLRSQKLDDAKALVDSLVERAPKSTVFRRLHGQLALALGRPAEALQDFNAVVAMQTPGRTDPALADDQLARARILFENKKYAETAKACVDALRVRADHQLALVFLVRSLLELGKLEDAVTACDRFMKKGSAFPELYKLRGQAKRRLGDQIGAIDDYSRFLFTGEEADALLQRGWSYLECQAWQLALHDFQKVTKFSPNDPFALNSLALAEAAMGQHAKAVADAEASLQLQPNVPSQNYNVACAIAMAASKVDAQDAKLAAQYRARAAVLLQKSMELRPENDRAAFWKKTVVTDAFLDSIRKEPGYLLLKQQYGQSVQ